MFAELRGASLKTGDNWAVPVCHVHHKELHESFLGERLWWAAQGIDPVKEAEGLWATFDALKMLTGRAGSQ
jgi:hypothetical protein